MTSSAPEPIIHQRSIRRTIFWITPGLVALTLLARLPFLPRAGFGPDQVQFMQWSMIARDAGVAGVYAPIPRAAGRRICNYPSLYPLVLRAMASLWDQAAPTDWRLNDDLIRSIASGDTSSRSRWAGAYFKLPAVLADAALVVTIFLCLRRRSGARRAAVTAGLLALAPIMIHNSAVWGQMDSIVALFIVLSLEAALRGRLGWMTAWAALAILTKPQALALAPCWLAVWWSGGNRLLRERSGAALAAIAVITLLLLPFSDALAGVWQAYAGAAERYPYTHLNGFSVWFVGNALEAPHLSEDLSQWYIRDELPGWLGLPPRSWGLVGIALTWLMVIGDLVRRRGAPDAIRRAAVILPLAFFLLSTQMHERYLLMSVVTFAWAGPRGRVGWICWFVIAMVASVNEIWSWPGPAGAGWTSACNALFRGTWLAAPCGVWCAVALACVLITAWHSTSMWNDRTVLPRRIRGEPTHPPA